MMKLKTFFISAGTFIVAILLVLIVLNASNNVDLKSFSLPKFSLKNQFGKTISEKDIIGNYNIVLFGFSKCPFICPTQLGQLTSFFNNFIDDSDIQKINVYFITLDAKNDTVDALNEYSKNFHTKIQMLTGEPTIISSIVDAYKVYYLVDNKGEINHSSVVYFIGKDGKFLTTLDLSDEDAMYSSIKDFMK